MKILFITPPFPKNKVYTSLKYTSQSLSPLGLAYMAAVLEEVGHEVEIIDANLFSVIFGYDLKNLERDIRKKDADIVGVTSTSAQIYDATDVLNVVKKILPETTTLLGGPHITAVPGDVNNIKSLDYGILGEGEMTILEISNKLKNEQRIDNLPGVISKNKGKIRYIPRKLIENIDEIPFPARHLLPMKFYRPSIIRNKISPAATMLTSRGCPHKCIFCDKSVTGFKFRPHSPERVIDEIEHLMDEYGIRDIRILDDLFTYDRRRVVKILQKIIEKKLDIIWTCQTRVDRVDREILMLMKKAGCYHIDYGVESGSERILNLVRKGITKNQIRKAFGCTEEVGITACAFFMIGFPTETRKEIMKTINFAKELNPLITQFFIVSPLPNTELWELSRKKGKIKGNWRNYRFFAPNEAPFVPDTLNDNDLEILYRRSGIEFYFRYSYLKGPFIRNLRYFMNVRRGVMVMKLIGTMIFK